MLWMHRASTARSAGEPDTVSTRVNSEVAGWLVAMWAGGHWTALVPDEASAFGAHSECCTVCTCRGDGLPDLWLLDAKRTAGGNQLEEQIATAAALEYPSEGPDSELLRHPGTRWRSLDSI